MSAVIITSTLLMAAALALRGAFSRRMGGGRLMLIWAVVF